jgi:hypothetical protein
MYGSGSPGQEISGIPVALVAWAQGRTAAAAVDARWGRRAARKVVRRRGDFIVFDWGDLWFVCGRLRFWNEERYEVRAWEGKDMIERSI